MILLEDVLGFLSFLGSEIVSQFSLGFSVFLDLKLAHNLAQISALATRKEMDAIIPLT